MRNTIPTFIREPLLTEKAYSVWFAQLNELEQSTIISNSNNQEAASNNSMNMGFRLFSILESISINLLGKDNARSYFRELGYSGLESELMYLIFRNGLSHGINPRRLVYEDGEISWGLMSGSGTSGSPRHFPGYIDKENPKYNVPGDKAFRYVKLSDRSYHASLSLDSLVAHVKFDLEQRQKVDKRKNIQFVVGQHIPSKLPRKESVRNDF